MALVVKNQPANTGDPRDSGSTPVWGRCLGGGHDKPLQYSCLDNPMDRGAWRATVHRATKSRTRLKQLSMHTQYINTFLFYSYTFHFCLLFHIFTGYWIYFPVLYIRTLLLSILNVTFRLHLPTPNSYSILFQHTYAPTLATTSLLPMSESVSIL